MRRVTVVALALVLAACDAAGQRADGAPTASASAQPATSATGSESAEATAPLTFVVEGQPLRSLEQRAILAEVEPVTFTAFDPYYRRPKTYRALPLAAVLELGFGGRDIALEEQHFVLRAEDGYTVAIEGKRLLAEGAYLAIDDLDTAGGWEPLGRRRVSPGPYYLVWRGEDQQDLETHPRPYMLRRIEVSSFERAFPRTVPKGLDASHDAWRGFRLFRDQCLRCHAINQQGGRVGPELNVPQSIIEYRPEAQIRAYIEDPTTFRYGNMPPNPHLTDEDIDGLIAYFRAMSERKQDPEAPGGKGR